ncbi:MAG TPA: LysE family transporter [Saprospiraceae bacterium]|nr:LysE family transporter [Saprospiraceae bacterium]HMP12793.1 LysE family transporter [Saprospiraceae bacterium]
MFLSLLSVFFIVLIISFFGSLPFGPINLMMIETTLRNSLRAGIPFSVAAALVEMGQSWVALQGSTWIEQLLKGGPWVQLAGFVFFLLLGLVFLFKKNQQEGTSTSISHRGGPFIKGFVVASLNPQAIPFWIIILAILRSENLLEISAQSPFFVIITFTIAASAGKLAALLLFGLLSVHIFSRMALLRKHLNRIIGFILIGIGMAQAIFSLLV